MVQRNRLPLAAIAGALILATLGIVTAGEGNRPVEPLLREPEPLPFLSDERSVPCELPSAQTTRGPSQPDGTFVDLTRGPAQRQAPPVTQPPEPPRRLPALEPTPAQQPTPAERPVQGIVPVSADLQPNVADHPAAPQQSTAAPQPIVPPQRFEVIEARIASGRRQVGGTPQRAAGPFEPEPVEGRFDPFAAHTAAVSYTAPMPLHVPSTSYTPGELPPGVPGPFEILSPETVVREDATSETVSHDGCVDCCPQNCPPVGPLGRMREHWHTRIKPWLERTHWGYPDQFIQPPLGFYVAAHARTQIANGQQSLLTLYHFDFEQVGERDRLTPRGRLQLEKFAAVLAYRPFSLLIERTVDDPELDQARYQHVVEALAQFDVPLAAERVVVGRPTSRGMFGPEARMHAERSLEPPQAMGAPMGTGFGAGTSDIGGGVGAGTQ